MATYDNGRVPYSVVNVVLSSGTDSNGYWEFRCTPAFAARWALAKKKAQELYGRPIYIRTGWNIYRPYSVQFDARARACRAGNCNGASVAGYSSHGGNWGGRDCLAVDVDPNGLTWDQVDRAMEAAGFSARLITEAMSGIKGGERWHYIDFNAFGAIPSGLDSTPFEEDDMTPEESKLLKDIRTTQLEDSGALRNVISKQITDMQLRIASMHAGSYKPWDNKPENPGGTLAWLDEKLAATAATIVKEIPSGAGVDATALANQLGPLLAPVISDVLQQLVSDIAVASADEEDRRDREALDQRTEGVRQ